MHTYTAACVQWGLFSEIVSKRETALSLAQEGMLRQPIIFEFGKMAAFGARERSVGEGGGARVGSDLLLHPELLSQEFLLLTLEQKNIPVEDEVKINKDGLTDLYVQHVIPLPQRELPKTRWGKVMEKKRGQQVLKHDVKRIAPMESLRKRPLIVFDGSSTSTSIKVRKTENGAIDSLKLLTAESTSTTCRSSKCMSAFSFSPDVKVQSRIDEAKQNNITINNKMASGQKSPTLVPLTGTTVVKLKRAAPKEESDASQLS
ncbi:ashwin isoform X2 [Rhineura floridana]|uniref:ashwin isoform X2 n=1 Tax=Rhineura floridana TaxID=261503 RepID=UPI002AC86742|nr:ashwin isoform X2 [Rhineura floridana]